MHVTEIFRPCDSSATSTTASHVHIPAAMPTPAADDAPTSAPLTEQPHERFQSGIRLCEPAPESVRVNFADLEVQSTTLRALLAVDIDHASDSQFYCGLSGDMAEEGGVFVSTYRPLQVGTPVVLELTLLGSTETVLVKGNVVFYREHTSTDPAGVGISIQKLEEEDRRRVEAFCRLREPLYYDDVG